MSQTTRKTQIIQKVSASDTLLIHPETESDIVLYDHTASELEATNVKGAIDELKELIDDINSGLVTGVKGNAESSFRTGQVNLTPANIGAVAANTAITGATKAKITYDSKGLVTGGADLADIDIPSLPASKIGSGTLDAARIPSLTLSKISDAGTAAGATLETTGISSDTNTVPTTKQVKTYVDGAISGINQFDYAKVTNAADTPEGVTWTSGSTTITGTLVASASTKYRIYLVPSANGTKDNYDEYLTVNPTSSTYQWEKIGNTDVDLSGYVPTSRTVNGHALTENVSVTKGDVGLGNVENTKLSTWSGSSNITTIGTISSGSVPASKVTGLAGVATSGSYSDLTNKPTIPATNVIPATNTEKKILISTSTSGTAKWSDFSTAGFIKTDNTGKVSVDSSTYLKSNQTITTTVKSGKKADGSTDISASGSGATSISVTLGDSGVTAGTYSAVQVNAKGITVAGGQIIEVGSVGQSEPSATLATGGIFFKAI